eukprot:1900589-Amphidinium_carterae.1
MEDMSCVQQVGLVRGSLVCGSALGLLAGVHADEDARRDAYRKIGQLVNSGAAYNVFLGKKKST